MENISAGLGWPDSMLSRYGDMLSVRDVAGVLNVEELTVRHLLSRTDARSRLPGVKVGGSWRIARDQLRGYLLAHHNQATPSPGSPDEALL